MSTLQNVLSHSFTLTGPGGSPSCPQPTEQNPFRFEDVPEEFGVVRGIGGGTLYTANARDCTFLISCKTTDAAHAWLHAKRAGQQGSKLTPGWAGEQMTWYRGDTGETWTGIGCVIQNAPAGVSTETPESVEWRILVSAVQVTGPSLIPVVA